MQDRDSAIRSAQMLANRHGRAYTVYRIDNEWHYTLDAVPRLTEAQIDTGKVPTDITRVSPSRGDHRQSTGDE